MSDTVTPLSLSAAMRLGAMSTSKGIGNDGLLGDDRCALGCALFAIGFSGRLLDAYDAVNTRWPISTMRVLNPVTGDAEMLTIAAWSLNDTHGWTREAIASWVETIGHQQAQSSSTVNVLDQVAVPV